MRSRIKALREWKANVPMLWERGKIKAQLREGRTLGEIAEHCKYHDRDDILLIKNELWNAGWTTR